MKADAVSRLPKITRANRNEQLAHFEQGASIDGEVRYL